MPLRHHTRRVATTLVLIVAGAVVTGIVVHKDPVRLYHRYLLRRAAKVLRDACILARTTAIARNCKAQVGLTQGTNGQWCAVVQRPWSSDGITVAAALTARTNSLPHGVVSDQEITVVYGPDGRFQPAQGVRVRLTTTSGRRCWTLFVFVPWAKDKPVSEDEAFSESNLAQQR